MPIPYIAILWIIGSLIAGLLGKGRWIGFWGCLLISLAVSPLPVIAVLVLTHPSKARVKRQAS